MELRELRYFQAVVSAGSVSAAARAIHIAQPALTRQIKALEQEIGVTLLTRHVSGVELTVAGQAFYQDINRLLVGLEEAAHTARMLDAGMSGELSIGVTVMILWVREVSHVLKSFRSAYPEVMLKVNTMLSGPQVAAIEQGTLDAGVLMFPPDNPELDSMSLFQDSLALVAPTDSDLVASPPQKLSDLNEHGFVWFDRENSPAYHDHLLDYFHQQEFMPNIIEKGSDAVTMLSLVASGVGCTIVPKMTLNGMPAGLTTIEVSDLCLPIDLQLVWRKGNTNPVLRHLLDIAREEHGN